jgi:hypothetical protein
MEGFMDDYEESLDAVSGHVSTSEGKVLDSKDKGVGSKIYSFKNYSTADCIKHFGTKQYRFVRCTNFFSIEKRSKMVFGTAKAADFGR